MTTTHKITKHSAEQQLIEAIKQLPGYQVFPGNGCVMIARTCGSSVSQQSVWLGRSSTLERLQAILDKARTDSLIGRTIVHMGRVWRVIGVGAVSEGNTFCHLASVYEFRVQKNGRVPLQINDWVDTAVLAAAKGV